VCSSDLSLTRLGEASGFRMPGSLEEWSVYDARSVETPWISRKQKIQVKQIADFYLPWAYPNQLAREKVSRSRVKPLYWVFSKACRLRVSLGYYGLPWEWKLARALKLT